MIDEAPWRVQETADYLCERGYKDVTLQFPDGSLQYASRVAVAVQAVCASRGHAVQAYILADTTYNSLSVDEVAAAHVNAQCVVHYGRASLTKLSRVPAFFVFPEQQVDVTAVAACLAGSTLLASLSSSSSGNGSSGDAAASDAPGRHVLVFLDQPLLHLLESFKGELLRIVEQQQGAAGAGRLVFPAVQQQHMEPESRQGRAGAACSSGRPAGCCGGAGCNGQQQQPSEPRQAQQQQQQQQAQGPACCQGAEACAPPPATNAPSAAAATAAAATAAAAAAAAAYGLPGGQPAAGDAATASSDGCQHSLAGYTWRLPAGVSTRDCGLAWVGAPDAPALLQLQLTYSGCPWAMLDPARLLPSPAGAAKAAEAGGPGATAPAAASAAHPAAAAGAACSGAEPALVEGLPLEVSRALRRRYFLVEKARDASIVGILVGTLGAAGYAGAVAGLRAAAGAAGKKSYTLLMGKPSPAKLANFPEIEVFVLVADPQGQILDSKEYLAPIITPHEAMLAWGNGGSGSEWDERRYSLGFEGVLEEQAAEAASPAAAGCSQQQRRRQREEPRFSLLAGGYTGGGGSGSEDEGEGDQEEEEQQGGGRSDPGSALALHAQQALVVSDAPQGRSDLVVPRSAADYLLHKRSWQGVEAPLVGAAPKAVEAAVEGRSGRAAGYVDEPGKQQPEQAG